MRPRPFRLERYFAQHEFAARRTLCSSDCEPLSLTWLLARADAETLALWRDLRLGYTHAQGLPLLRGEIARMYRGIETEEVLVAAPEEAIFVAMNCLLHPGDHVVCTFPGYQSLYEVAESLGCEVSRWEPIESEGWRFGPAQLASLVRPNTRLVVCNFPHNPTGYLPPADDWARIVDLVRERGIYLFSDEMYRLLEHQTANRLPAAAEVYERAVSLAGLSKAFGLAGLRVGWIVTRDERLLQEISAFKDYTTICASAPSEILATMALRARPEIVSRHLACIERNLDALESFSVAHAATLCWNRPQAGSVCFPRLLTDDGASSFCARVFHDKGILLLPSTVFQYGDRHVRLGLGREDFPEVLSEFGDYLDAAGLRQATAHPELCEGFGCSDRT